MRNPFLRKPIGSLSCTSSSSDTGGEEGIARHMTLRDLVFLGLGGTIGSGIFVLSGQIARNQAGAATPICFLISGVCAVLSGCCYAELSANIPASGSAYTFVYASCGEYFAVLAAACLTLEYLVSGSAVARNWGDKVLDWLTVEMEAGDWAEALLAPFGRNGFNPLAGILSAATLWLLYSGVKESKKTTNIVTVAKVGVVCFMIVGGFALFDGQNLSPYVGPKGFSGVLQGATTSFFGYLGYDEVCCVAGEAIDPTKNVPKAVMMTIMGAAVLYFFASTALTGMQPFDQIDENSGFPGAFHYNGATISAQIAAIGELSTLPLVVLVSLLAQPRVFYMMALDGLLPPVFKEVEGRTEEEPEGNLRKGIMICGVAMTVIATFVPFTILGDMISAGVLVSFSLTDSSLLFFRRRSSENGLGWLWSLKHLVTAINILSFVCGLSVTHFGSSWFGVIMSLGCFGGVCKMTHMIDVRCPEVESHDSSGSELFRTPYLPYLPCTAIFVNWYLVAQLEMGVLLLLLVYFGVVTIFYFTYSIKHSVGNNIGWRGESGEGGGRGGEMEMSDKRGLLNSSGGSDMSDDFGVGFDDDEIEGLSGVSVGGGEDKGVAVIKGGG